MNNNDLNRNGSGCIDPKAGQALKNIVEEEKRVSKVIKTIQAVAHLAGYEIEGRIVLKEKDSGYVWR